MINNNTIMANIRSDNALATILSRFSTEYIVNMVKDSLEYRFNPYGVGLPSIYAIEAHFKAVIENTDASQLEQVEEVRESTYNEIIAEICKYYGLEFIRDYNSDIYSSAYWIYDFFVANFTNYFFDFFVNYIIKEKDALYNYLNFESMKKDKDSFVNYSKKITIDHKLALIHANILTVLDSIMVFDISLENIIDYSIIDPNLKAFLMNSVKDINGNVFNTRYASIYYTKNRVDVITNIKLKLQEKLISDITLVNGETSII